MLRAEIEPIIKEEGWTKNAMGKMWRLDSFMKESQRLNGMSAGRFLSQNPAYFNELNISLQFPFIALRINPSDSRTES